jgi:endonuclease/exonuclease/phosphatase (EEP) superfamily protein YafD
VTSTQFSSPANQNQAPQKSKKRLHRDWSGAALFLLFSVIGLVLGRLGHLWIAFDVFSQFSMQFMFLGLAMILGLAFPRFKGLAGLVLFALMIVSYALWPQLQVRTGVKASAPTGTQRLHVASFNTFYGNKDVAAIAAEIKTIDADVVSLIEFGPEKKAALDLLRQTYPYQIDCHSEPGCDQAIISKYVLRDAFGKGEQAWEGPTYLRASLGPQFGNATIVAVHTSRFPHANYQFRQVQAFIDVIGALPGRLIITGDFNATPFSRVTQILGDGLGLTRLTNLPSWPATYSFPQLAIDHIFVSKDIIALDQERLGHYAGSDHFPISITLAVPQN